MDIAITGSTGLIGTALTGRLESDGHRVVPVTRSGSHGIHWDPARGEIDAAAFEGIGAVVNLAGEGIAEKRWSEEQKQKIFDSRVEGTTLLAKTLAGLNRPPSVLLSGSAVGYYGERGDQTLTEGAPAGGGFLAEVCVAWERATEAAEQSGIRVAHLRTGMVLSTKGGALPKMLRLYKLGLGGKLGSGRQQMSWITIDDEVGAIAWLVDHPISGAVNLTAPQPVTNQEFNHALGQAVHRPTLLPVPKFGPKLLLGAELAEGLLFTSARVVPDALTKSGYPFAHPTLPEALAAVLAG